MNSIKAHQYNIVSGEGVYEHLAQHLNEQKYSKLFFLTDVNCNEHCMPYFLNNLPIQAKFEIIEIEPGEENKILETAQSVIQAMLEIGADRKSAIITLGGGVITDLGGFIASIYMRGIDCYNIPTTLLSMVDASVGGKTGVDCDGIKNCIGTFSMPKMVVIDPAYLESLPVEQLRSGYGEMIKHGLIKDKVYFDYLKDISKVDLGDLQALILHSVGIKNEVVLQDPKEADVRKILNYGHTVGHAIESYYLSQENKTSLLHGEAIAIGMVIEAYISNQLTGLSKGDMQQIKDCVFSIYGQVDIQEQEVAQIMQWLKFDKKNIQGVVRCVLLTKIGEAVWDIEVSNELIVKGFEYYMA